MASPFDYSLNIASPIESALQGLSFGQGINNMQVQRQQQQFAMQQQQAALAKAQQDAQIQAENRAVQSAYVNNPAPTLQDTLRYSATLPPEMVKALQPQFAAKTEAQQKALLGLGSRVVSSLLSPNPEVGIDELTAYATALEATDPAQAKSYKAIADVAKQNPAIAFKMIAPVMATLPGGPELLKASYEAQAKPIEMRESEAKAKLAEGTLAPGISKAQSEATTAAATAKFAEEAQRLGIDEKRWNITNLRSQIGDRAKRLNLDEQAANLTALEKLAQINKLNTDIPADTRKAINEATITSATAQQSADQFNSLATRIAEAGGNYGVFSSASDFIKKAGGFQGGMTQLKQEYTRLRNTAAIKSLPPGPATDKDIQMALSGFPSDTASANDLAQFLRGMAKLQTIDSNVAGAQAEWLAQNNGQLTRAKNAFTTGNFAARPGETFADLTKRIAEDVNKRYDSRTLPKGVDLIPTPGNPNPQANNIRAQADAIIGGGR